MFQAYLISSLIDGKIYVGVTSRGLNRRWAEHLCDAKKRNAKMTISRAIAKHGAENFVIESVCSAKSWADICAVESMLIVQFKSRAPHGYNNSNGGEGPFGVKRSAESVERSASKHRGKPCHPNTRRVSSEFHKGRPKSPETRAKMSAAMKGKSRSEETKAKIRASWAARRAAGEFKTDKPYAHARKAASAAVYRP